MDDNMISHQCLFDEDYFKSHSLEQMEWTIYKPESEYIWDCLDIHAAALRLTTRFLHELEQFLKSVWKIFMGSEDIHFPFRCSII